MKPGKLYGVGIGPGDPRYLTLRAADVLRSVDVIFTVISQNASSSVSRSVVESLEPRGEIHLQIFSMSRDKAVRAAQVQANADAIITELKAGRDCAFATLGDAMTYSTFGYVLEIIREAIPGVELEIVPGITSFATLTAKAGTVLVENGEQLRVIPSFKSEMAETLDFPKGPPISRPTVAAKRWWNASGARCGDPVRRTSGNGGADPPDRSDAVADRRKNTCRSSWSKSNETRTPPSSASVEAPEPHPVVRSGRHRSLLAYAAHAGIPRDAPEAGTKRHERPHKPDAPARSRQ
ncbi:MAG: precorrin-2 C(20)-methyltransferase [Bilophila wadsworthia]